METVINHILIKQTATCIWDNCCYTDKHIGAAYSICNLKCKTPRKIVVVFHNGSNYDYKFIIKGLVKKLKWTFKSLGCITFWVIIKKEINYVIKRVDK